MSVVVDSNDAARPTTARLVMTNKSRDLVMIDQSYTSTEDGRDGLHYLKDTQ